jgi:hypothetical protein
MTPDVELIQADQLGNMSECEIAQSSLHSCSNGDRKLLAISINCVSKLLLAWLLFELLSFGCETARCNLDETG